jgi:hypothetical protein
MDGRDGCPARRRRPAVEVPTRPLAKLAGRRAELAQTLLHKFPADSHSLSTTTAPHRTQIASRRGKGAGGWELYTTNKSLSSPPPPPPPSTATPLSLSSPTAHRVGGTPRPSPTAPPTPPRGETLAALDLPPGAPIRAATAPIRRPGA